MTLEEAKAQMEAATASAKAQIEVHKASLGNQLDAADRVIMRKAADTVLTITPAVVANPT